MNKRHRNVSTDPLGPGRGGPCSILREPVV